MPYVSSYPSDAFMQLIMQYSPEAAFAPGGQQVSDPAAVEWLLNQMAAQQGNPWGDEGTTGSDFSITGYGVADRPLQPSDLPTYVPPPEPTAPPANEEGGGGGTTFTSNVYAPKPIEPIPSPLPNQLNLPLPAEPVMPYPEADPKFQGPVGPVIDMGFKIPITVTGRAPVEPVQSPLPNKLPPPPNQGPPPGSQGDPGNPPPTNPPANGEKPSNPLGQIAAAALPFMASQEGKGGGLAVPMVAPVVGTNTMQNSLFPMQQQGVPIPGNLFSFIKGGMIR